MNKNTSKPRKPSVDELREQLCIPPRTVNAFDSLEAVKKAFSLPVTLGCADEQRFALDAAFDSAGGFRAIYQSLTGHAYDMGQYPMSSFIGYGVLQQIAQNGMIRACISTVADDMSKKWISFTGSDDSAEKLTELEKKCETKYHLSQVFHDAFTTCGYMGGAFIFIDTGEKDLHLPLAINDKSAEFKDENGFIRRELKFLVVDPINVSPAEYNASDPLRSDYMLPHHWYVLGKRVHASRLLRIVDNEPPVLLRPSYNFLGIPQAQILWDYVLHFNECRTYTANLLRKLSLLVVKTDTDAVLSDPDGIARMDAKMEMLGRYRDNDSVFVCDKDNEDVANIQTTITGTTDIVKQCLEMICAINRTPAVKLLGISPSGFNATGESDLKNYYDLITAKQAIHRQAIDRCIKAIQLAEYGCIDPEISFDFEPLDIENSASQAMTAQTKVGGWGQLLDRQVISAEELRQAVKKDPDIGLDFIDEEMPEELEQAQQQALQNGEQESLQTDDPEDSDNPMNAFMEQAKNEQTQNSTGGRAQSGNKPSLQEKT